MTISADLIDRLADAVAARVTIQPAPQVAGDGRLSLTIAEAAKALRMSSDHFRRHVLPGLRVVRSGRLRLIPIRELEEWLARSAARVNPQ